MRALGTCKCCKTDPATEQLKPFPEMCDKCYHECPAAGNKCRRLAKGGDLAPEEVSDKEFEAYRKKLLKDLS
jgi:hypothetical protein